MSYMIVDVLGFTGVAGETSLTLGDSSVSASSALGQYGSLTNAQKSARKEELVRIGGVASAAAANKPNVGDGSNSYIGSKREQYL